MLEELPEPVKNYIIEQSKNEYEYVDNRFSISELVYCLKKSYYRRKNPIPPDLSKAWYFFRGELFHNALGKLFEKNEGHVTHRIRGTPIVITGRYDVKYENEIIEFKTIASLKYINKVKPQHKLQCEFYSYCEGLDKGKVVYIDLANAKSFTININEKDIDHIELSAKLLSLSLKNSIPPEPINLESWECKFCSHNDMCDKANKK